MSLASFSPHAATSAPSAINAASASSPDNTDRRHPSSPPSSPSSFTLPGQLLLLKQQYKSGNDAADSPYKSSSGRPLTVAPQPRPRNVTTTRYPPHLYVLPVLLLEFLALALTRAVLPSMLLQEYGNRVYLVLGLADCVRGLLAFVACPLFGKLSDQVGRKLCLFITVIGTCAPVCSLALFHWKTPTIIVNNNDNNNNNDSWFSGSTTSSAAMPDYELPPMAIPIFVVLLSLSGIFSSTFTLVFAYISDTVPAREERVSAYGLALATFGLSFTIGPMAGGYLAKTHTHYVFMTSLLLTILDILYIWFILPESRVFDDNNDHDDTARPATLSSSNASATSIQQVLHEQFMEWHPLDAIRMVLGDPFLRHVGQVAFFYYTGLWAVISTLSLYAVQHFHLGPERLGELMSALGLCTMIAEAVLVRLLVPWWGEKHAIKVGLASFAMQCIVLGAAHQVWHLFVCVAFSLLGNLVYPSLSSLVSSTVEPCQVGQALGALNGVKALTEGIGPLLFGALMTVSEDSDYFPGWPYWIAALLVLIAYDIADRKLPNDDDDIVGYVHELEFKQRRRRRHQQQNSGAAQGDSGCLSSLATTSSTVQTTTTSIMRDDENEEYQDLLPLSEVEEDDDDDNDNGGSSIATNETNKDESSSWAFATPTKKKHAVVGVEEEAKG